MDHFTSSRPGTDGTGTVNAGVKGSRTSAVDPEYTLGVTGAGALTAGTSGVSTLPGSTPVTVSVTSDFLVPAVVVDDVTPGTTGGSPGRRPLPKMLRGPFSRSRSWSGRLLGVVVAVGVADSVGGSTLPGSVLPLGSEL